ncbi:MAG: MBL fold metallo-hydrolase [Rhodobacter sp.]|nr:MBL fold metallo-hydrolase [Rhodobacter sp.]
MLWRALLSAASPQIRCLTADNPSPLTGAGTNTYLLGSAEIAVIDPGPDLPGHLIAILGALAPGERVTRIVVTHAHRDHSALAPRLAAATGAEVLAFGPALSGRSPLMTRLAPDLPASGEGLDLGFQPDTLLADNDRVTGPDWELAALHTPGHLGGHLCLALGDTLFSGDHVMGWSTTLISPPDGDMAAYMASLRRLQSGPWQRFLPGHGDPVEDPAARMAELVAHRLGREGAILAQLAENPATIPDLARRIYRDTPVQLLPAAERNVLAHLIDLASRNLVTASPALHPAALFHRL